jgi:sialic acid synthase SpsE
MINPEFLIESTMVGLKHPTYFIADISANHDGDLERAKALIHLAAQAGAQAAKFQNFRASQIVSKEGFESLGGQLAHQAKWKKSVFQVYQEASVPLDWTPILKQTCEEAGICFFSTPYDFEAADHLDPYVSVYKIGSGDMDWLEFHDHLAKKGKPVLLAAGASELGEVVATMKNLSRNCSQIGLMQCNTNYTGSLENFRHINLRVLESFRLLFPEAVLGLSDHTPGHATVLGAVALGARLIEKHFTDDPKREGPDHTFSMSPKDWRDMVDRTRELELSLGSTVKTAAANEVDTIVVQRRCVRAARDIAAGTIISRDEIEVLRPSPDGSVKPNEIGRLIGKTTRRDIVKGAAIHWADMN